MNDFYKISLVLLSLALTFSIILAWLADRLAERECLIQH